MTGHCSSSESKSCNIVDVDGFQYFVMDRDVSKGDRWSDGKFMSDFFTVVERPVEATTNVRQSQRVVKKRDLAHTLCVDSVEDPEICNVDVVGSIKDGTVLTSSKKRQSVIENTKGVILGIIRDP
jgi:hypothetical protein